MRIMEYAVNMMGLTNLRTRLFPHRYALMMLFLLVSFCAFCAALLAIRLTGNLTTAIIQPFFFGGFTLVPLFSLIITIFAGLQAGSQVDLSRLITYIASTVTLSVWLITSLHTTATFDLMFSSLCIIFLVGIVLLTIGAKFKWQVAAAQIAMPVIVIIVMLFAPLNIQDTRGEATINFHLNRTIEYPGALHERFPMELEWDISDIDAIFLNDRPSIGQSTIQIDRERLNAGSAYLFDVRFVDGSEKTYRVDIRQTGIQTWAVLLTAIIAYSIVLILEPDWQIVLPPLLLLFMLPFLHYRLQIDVRLLPVSGVLTAVIYFLLRSGRSKPLTGGAAVFGTTMILLAFGINIAFPYDRYHHNFFLGPVNDVMHGKTVFVDGAAQYGMMISYFLAGYFRLFSLPVSYHGFSLLISVLFLIQCGIYYYLFVSRRRSYQMVQIMILIMALLVIIRSTISIHTHPSTGPMRYGLILLYVPVALMYTRTNSRLWYGLQFLVVYAAAMWSIETLAGTVAISLSLLVYQQIASASRWRDALFAILTHTGFLIAATALGIMTFSGFTWLRSGQFPIWDLYFGFVFTYADHSDWWIPGMSELLLSGWSAWFFPYLILYGTLACLLYRFLFFPRNKLMEHFVVFGVTLLGLLGLYYWIRLPLIQSLGGFLPPLIFLIFYWIDEVFNSRMPRQFVQVAKIAFIFVVVHINVWAFTARLPESTNNVPLFAIASSVSATPPLERVTPDMLYNPPISALCHMAYCVEDHKLEDTIYLLESHFMGQTKIAIFANADTALDAMMRTGHVHIFNTSNPAMEDGYSEVGRERLLSDPLPLEAGDLILVDSDESELYSVQLQLLEQVRANFDFETVEETDAGLAVVRLQSKS